MRIVGEAENIKKYWEYVREFPVKIRIAFAKVALFKAVMNIKPRHFKRKKNENIK